jgi:hypothetical protein
VNDNQQQRVTHLASEIMSILAGIEEDEACTALTVSVVAAICALADNTHEARMTMADAFYAQVISHLHRPDVVDWIRANTTWLERAPKQ